MQIVKLEKKMRKFKKEAALLLKESFPKSYDDSSLQELNDCLSADRIALGAIVNNQLVGFIGAIPQYGTSGWELHPLVVNKSYRLKGIGSRLVKALEDEILLRGGLVIYLGSDDEKDQTSLSNNDLFHKTYEKIEKIENYKNHPYEFYQKSGYKIVGVIPDANGLGKPDIIMAKRLTPFRKDII